MFVTFTSPKEVEAIDYPLLGEFTNFSDYDTSPLGEAIAVDGQKVVLLNDETSFNPFGFFKNRNFTAGTYIVMDGRLQSVDLFHKENLIVEGFDTDLVNKALVPNYRYTFMAENPLNLTATGKTITDQAGALVVQPFVPEINERYFLRLLESGDYVLELESVPSETMIVREDFDGFTAGQTTITVTAPIPDNVRVEVFRNGVLMRAGAGNDYVLNTNTGLITLTSPLGVPESMVVLWVVEGSMEFREDFDSVVAGITTITPAINGGVLPVNTTNIRLSRNGILLREGVANDYTVAGNIITITTATFAGESFSLIINA